MIQNLCKTTLLTTSSWKSILATWLKSQLNTIDRNLIFWNWGNNNSVSWLFNGASNTISWFNIIVLRMQHHDDPLELWRVEAKHPHWWKRNGIRRLIFICNGDTFTVACQILDLCINWSIKIRSSHIPWIIILLHQGCSLGGRYVWPMKGRVRSRPTSWPTESKDQPKKIVQ